MTKRIGWLSAALLIAAGTTTAVGDGPSVRLRYATFDPLVGTPAVPASLRATGEGRLFLVQFASTPTEPGRAALRGLGGVAERFLTDNTYVVWLPSGAERKAAAAAGVRWVGPYHPAYRLSAEAMADVMADDGAIAAHRYSIECMQRGPEQQGAVASCIKRLGGVVELTSPDQFRMEATLTPAQLLAVAQRDEVNFIDIWGGPPGHDMHLVRQLGGAAPFLAAVGVSGRGVRGEVMDQEINLAHVALQNPPPLVHGPQVGTGTFGTSTYGIVFANWPAMPDLTGMLPDREQGIYGDFQAMSLLQRGTELLDPAGPYRGVFLSSSVGSAFTNAYSTISAQTDDALFHLDLLMTQSIGNAAPLTRPQALAKNIVAVGGINYQGTLDRSDDSSGPAFDIADGRIKPDLVHCADQVDTISGETNTATATVAGTSASAAITAGYFGLIMQLWHEGAFPGFGRGASVFTDRPHAATAKALAINSAYRYDWTVGGPNASLTRGVQGWGMIDAGELYRERNSLFIVNQTDVLTQGQTAQYTLEVPPGQQMFAATLAYADPMGNPASVQARVNDLSLRVTAPTGQTYWGNHGLSTGNVSTPGGQADTANTVENVFLPNPAAGLWVVEVIGSEIVQDAHLADPEINADFGLVVSGVASSCYANCDRSTTPPVLNVNDFVCFLGRFAAGALDANCDGSTASPVLNVADFVCFQQSFAAGCP